MNNEVKEKKNGFVEFLKIKKPSYNDKVICLLLSIVFLMIMMLILIFSFWLNTVGIDGSGSLGNQTIVVFDNTDL